MGMDAIGQTNGEQVGAFMRFGGGPTIAYSVTLLRDSIERFKNDFNK